VTVASWDLGSVASLVKADADGMRAPGLDGEARERYLTAMINSRGSRRHENIGEESAVVWGYADL
jgi:hypothetical protein